MRLKICQSLHDGEEGKSHSAKICYNPLAAHDWPPLGDEMPKLENIAVVLFDMDGTLLEYTWTLEKICHTLFQKYEEALSSGHRPPILRYLLE